MLCNRVNRPRARQVLEVQHHERRSQPQRVERLAVVRDHGTRFPVAGTRGCVLELDEMSLLVECLLLSCRAILSRFADCARQERRPRDSSINHNNRMGVERCSDAGCVWQPSQIEVEAAERAVTTEARLGSRMTSSSSSGSLYRIWASFWAWRGWGRTRSESRSQQAPTQRSKTHPHKRAGLEEGCL